MLDLLAERLANEEGLEETEIWVDGFYGFTPQEFRVLGQLMRLAKQVNITLTMDEYSLNQKSLPLSAPFFELFLTTQNLKKIALEEGIKVLAPFVLEENKRTKADALCFLEKNYFYYYEKPVICMMEYPFLLLRKNIVKFDTRQARLFIWYGGRPSIPRNCNRDQFHE